MKCALIITIGLFLTACGGNSEKNKESIPGQSKVVDNGVFFIEPADGASVTSPVKVKMGVRGMEVEPAGMVNEGMGHHHIVIDGAFIPKGDVVPSDSVNIHFGGGQKETEVALSPGKHTLTLQFADGVHKSYGKDWSTTIQITVKDNN